MRHYIFYFVAFFLTYGVVIANIGPGIRQTSGRNVQELGDISESKENSTRPEIQNEGQMILNNPATKGTKTSSMTGTSCKTFEGKVYSKGEAGYSDCIRTIKTDRQKILNIP